jgi:hypothetical protein
LAIEPAAQPVNVSMIYKQTSVPVKQRNFPDSFVFMDLRLCINVLILCRVLCGKTFFDLTIARRLP